MIQAVLLDAYGTLFDLEEVTRTCNILFPGYGTQVSRRWRRTQLEYTWLRTVMNRYKSFDGLNRDALQRTLGSLDLWYDEDILQTLLETYLRLPPYPEVPQALRLLRPLSLSIVSDGTLDMLQRVVRNARLQRYFHRIFSVDAIRTYKPSPEVYGLAVNQLGITMDDILFVSSNAWDVAGASSFGLTTAWINRHNSVFEKLGVKPDYVAGNLQELVHLLHG